MARRFYISYKHEDKDVKFTLDKPVGTRPGDYASFLRNYVFAKDEVREEELGDEDLRGLSQEYVEQRLRAKLSQVDFFLLLITPWMQELNRELWEQWIPLELNYALGGVPGVYKLPIIGIVLPDKRGSVAYYKRLLHRGELLPLLSENIKNGYIHVTEWDSFRHYPEMALYGAGMRRETMPQEELYVGLGRAAV